MADLDGIPTWTLTHPDGARLRVCAQGAMALSWQVPGRDGEPVELLDGYTSAEEVRALDGYRNAVLAPWSNRVRDARYTWDGQSYDLAPGQEEEREALHGLVASTTWGAVDGDTGTAPEPGSTVDPAEEPALSLVTAVEPAPGYPFPIQVCVTYRLHRDADGAHRLSLELTAANTGTEAAPVALGWHPYVRLPGHDVVDDAELRIPARTRVRTDSALIPLPGEEAYTSTDGDAAPVGDRVLDTAFTDLDPDDDGVVRTVLSSSRGSITLEQSPRARVVHVFTGDTLVRDRRAALALEPCELMTDAFNRPELAEELTLPAGGTRTLDAALVYRP